MNQQGTSEIEGAAQREIASRDWEESDWFREWLKCHEHDAKIEEAD